MEPVDFVLFADRCDFTSEREETAELGYECSDCLYCLYCKSRQSPLKEGIHFVACSLSKVACRLCCHVVKSWLPGVVLGRFMPW